MSDLAAVLPPEQGECGVTRPESVNLAVDWNQSFDDAARDFVDFGLNLIAFLAILAVGFVLAKVLARLVDTALERTGFDQAVERGGLRQALARGNFDASDLVAKVVYYGILLVTLVVAFNVFGPNPVSDLLADVVAFLPNLIVAIIIVVVVAAVARAVKDLVTNLLSATPYGRLLGNLSWAFLIGLGVIAALQQVGVATRVSQALLVAVLATVGGVIVVGVGGGLVFPMAKLWETWLAQIRAAAPESPAAPPASGEPAAARAQASRPAAPAAPDRPSTPDGPTI